MKDKKISDKLNETKRLLSDYLSYLKKNKTNFGSVYNTIINISSGDIGPYNDIDEHRMAHSLYYILLIIIYNNIDLLSLGWITYNDNQMHNIPYGYSYTLIHFGATMFNNELRDYFINLRKKIKIRIKEMRLTYDSKLDEYIYYDDYYKELVSKDDMEVNKYDKNLLETVVSIDNEFRSYIELFVDLKRLKISCYRDRVDIYNAFRDVSGAMESMFTTGKFKFDLNLMLWLHQDIDKIKTKLNMFSKKFKYVRDKRSRSINERDADDERDRGKKPRFSNYMTIHDLKMFSQFFK